MSETMSTALQAGIAKNIQIANPETVEAVVVYNKSYLDVIVSGVESAGGRWVAAGTGDIFVNDGGCQGFLGLSPINTAGILQTQQFPALIVVYRAGDRIPKGSFPFTIPTQVINTVINAANTLVNDNSTPGVQIIEVKPDNLPSSTILLDNTGNFQLWFDRSGVLVGPVIKADQGANRLFIGNGSNPDVWMNGNVFFNASLDTGGAVGINNPMNQASPQSGTLQWQMPFYGTFKLFQVALKNVVVGASNIDITLPQPFTRWASFFTDDVGGYAFLSGGSVLAHNRVNTSNQTGTQATTTYVDWVYGSVLGGFDAVRIASGVQTHNGILTVFGS